MFKILSVFKLIRPINLAIIIISQILVYWCILLPLSNDAAPLNFALLFWLIFATVLIAAAGYAINDYFDLKTDRINKPEKIILGKFLNRKFAIILHSVFNIIAVVIGLFLTLKTGYLSIVFILLFTTFMLWLYSISLKKHFFFGNFVVSLLSSITILLPFFLYYGMQYAFSYLLKPEFNILLIYAGFAFFVSFIRELVKDMQDVRGDKSTGCKTIPIKLGLKKSQIIVAVISSLLIITVSYFLWLSYTLFSWQLLFYFGVVFVLMPLLVFLFIPIIQKKFTYKELFSLQSKLLKITMLFGTLSMIIYYFNINA